MTRPPPRCMRCKIMSPAPLEGRAGGRILIGVRTKRSSEVHVSMQQIVSPKSEPRVRLQARTMARRHSDSAHDFGRGSGASQGIINKFDER